MKTFSPSRLGLGFWGFSLYLLLVQWTHASAQAPPAKGDSVRISAEVTQIDHAPKLGGTLDDSLWQLTKPITEFRQREPHEGQQATEKAEVRILYARRAVYFGILCYDSEPSRIVATELRRDVSQDLDEGLVHPQLTVKMGKSSPPTPVPAFSFHLVSN
jgi:hypothetical protein